MLRETLGRFPAVYRFVNRLRGYRLDEPDIRLDYSVLGSWYGGWGLPNGVLDSGSIVYGFGVGEDVSFDLALIAQIGCTVHAFDPTPIAQLWVSKQKFPKEFCFHAVGVAAVDGEEKFYVPHHAHSFSRSPIPGRELSSISCPVRRLGSLMAQLGHERIDLLKMDIEGFEYTVINEFLDRGIRPTILNVEFHHRSYGILAQQTRDAVKRLRGAGYKIYWVSDVGREYGFILSGAAR